MRVLLVSFVVVLAGCPASEGPIGARGEPGSPGDTGPQGPIGPAGAAGVAGPMGAVGSMGAAGADGPVGPQGLQGAAGAVLVLDGGVVTGPPGSSVLVTPVSAGATCSGGGIRVTQLSDGGITTVCNGTQGLAGPVGASLTASALPPFSPQCATGGVLVGLADGGVLAVCNGAAGSMGATGSAGPAGAVGPMGVMGAVGAVGPMGPAGAMGQPGATGPALVLDGGLAFLNDTPSFAGFTGMTFTGNLGGAVGANQKCNAEFPGASFCTLADFDRSNPLAPPPAGAWIDGDRATSGARTQGSCSSTGGWSLGSSADTGTNLNTSGWFVSQVQCNGLKPLACCRVPTAYLFRGFTAATFTGNLGGAVGANSKCAAEYPGASFCTIADYDRANPLVAPPASGAWVDGNRNAAGARTQGSCSSTGGWTLGTTGDTGTNLNGLGWFVSQVLCNGIKPLACCQLR